MIALWIILGVLALILVLLLSGLGAAFLSIADHVSLENALYETISALCTVGLTTGITSSLGTAPRCVAACSDPVHVFWAARDHDHQRRLYGGQPRRRARELCGNKNHDRLIEMRMIQ